jgi:hypothetical protein
MFNRPAKGKSTKVQYSELDTLVLDYLKNIKDVNLDAKSIFDDLIKKEVFKDEEYFNFNMNRFNQILQRLYYKYEVDSLLDLIKKIQIVD